MVRNPKSVSEADRVRRIQAGGFTITEGIHRHGSQLPWHDHPTPTICFVLNGTFTEMWHGGTVACSSSTLKFTPAGERHRDQFDRGDVRGLLIEPNDDQVAAIRPHAAVLDERESFQGGFLSTLGWRIYHEMQRPDPAAPLAIEGLLLELIATASRLRETGAPVGRPRWLEEARDRIHAELSHRPTLSSLAQEVGVHPVTLARAFRQSFGCTVGEYVRHLRVERAAHQLAGTELSLAEIALAAGFSDQSHFSNMFREHTGLSPSKFRRVIRPA